MIDRSISKQYRWKVKSRLAVLEYVNVHGLKPAATRFGLDRKTIREWRGRARETGEVGLVPRYPQRRARRIPAEVVHLLAHARRDLQYGTCRTRIWVLRDHQVKVAAKTITRICHDLGLPPVQWPTRRRAARQLKLFEKATSGESVQADVKVVKLGHTKAYQYTACDRWGQRPSDQGRAPP
jgi:transposase